MKKLVIFGFDGTIVDASPGILYCLNTTALTIGYEPVRPEALYGVVGFSLESVLRNLYHMNNDEIEYATNNYSKMYSQKGKEMFTVYDGMIDAINELKSSGMMIAIATLKHIMFVSDMIEIMKIGEAIDAICATDVDTYMTKADLLLQACDKLGVSVEESVLIGDSNIEAQDAERIGMDYIAALYGWGYSDKNNIDKAKCGTFVNSPSELPSKIRTM